MAPKIKFNTLSLKDKIEVIRLKEQNCSVKDICLKFNCGKTQVYDAINKKCDLQKEFEEGNSSRKRKRGLQNEDIDELALEWFWNARSKNLPVTGILLREKAKEIAEGLEKTDFKASNGWLMSFLSRHNISTKQLCGESKDVPEEEICEWKENFHVLVEGYDPKDVYNCDETGLFYRGLPSKTLAKKGESCHGGKLSKERITVLLCSNAIGELEKPLVIGKSRRPRCFKNLNMEKLPVTWRSQKSSWMSSSLMEEWLCSLNNKMIKQSRKILLFLDNAPCHPDLKLSNVKLLFLPANTTSKTQPLDQGVIKMLKSSYRRHLLRSLLSSMDKAKSASELVKQVSLLDAVQWIAKSCSEISTQKISNCFKKAGFDFTLSNENSESIISEDESHSEEEDDLKNLISNLTCIPSWEKLDPVEYISIDDNICAEEAEISIDSLIQKRQCLEDDDTDNTDIEEDGDTGGIETYEDALKDIKWLENFFISKGNTEILPIVKNLQCATEKCVVNIKRKQTSI